MAATIDHPASNDNAKVVVQGGGPAGTICAHGEAAQHRFLNGQVRVKVWNGHISTPPENPPSGVVMPVVNDEWSGYVAVPSSSATENTARLTMFAWDMYGSGPYPYTYCWFYGYQSTSYDCGRFSAGPTTAVVSHAPLIWKLDLSGIKPPLHRLNKSWELRLQEGTSNESRWSNGEDGINSPKVELVCGGPTNPHWILRIQFGDIDLQYSAPEAWNAVTQLHLTAVNGKNVPTTITVKPG